MCDINLHEKNVCENALEKKNLDLVIFDKKIFTLKDLF